MPEQLRAFQKRVCTPVRWPLGLTLLALSIPRGNGKSWLAAHLLTRCLTPGDDLHVPGERVPAMRGQSIEQVQAVSIASFGAELEPKGELLDS